MFCKSIVTGQVQYIIIGEERNIPNGNGNKGYEVKHRDTGPSEKFASVLVAAGQVCTLIAVFIMGARFLLQQSNAANIVQASVSLFFILQVDDVAYDVFLPLVV